MALAGGLGRVNIDMLYAGMDHLPAPGEEVFSRRFGLYLGGGTPATLANLGRLGARTRLLTFLGDDFFSDFARRALKALGAEAVNLYRGGGMPVILSSAMVCAGDRAFMSYMEPVEVTDAMLDEAFNALKDADVVLMQPGFLPLYRALKRQGARLVFDTGWEEDLSLEKYGAYLALADYYLPNRREAMKITGAATPEQAAAALAAHLPTPVVKLYREGCLFVEGGEVRAVPPVPGVDAVDTTGAGDAFMAGFVYGLLRGEPTERCAQYGNITGAACVREYGCLTGYVTQAQLHETWERVYARGATRK